MYKDVLMKCAPKRVFCQACYLLSTINISVLEISSIVILNRLEMAESENFLIGRVCFT